MEDKAAAVEALMWVIAMLRLSEHIQTSPFIQQLFLQRFNLNVYIYTPL